MNKYLSHSVPGRPIRNLGVDDSRAVSGEKFPICIHRAAQGLGEGGILNNTAIVGIVLPLSLLAMPS